MQEKIAKLRESITDIAKAVGAENYEVITSSLEKMTDTVAELTQDAKNIAVQDAENTEKVETLKSEKAEALQKNAEMQNEANASVSLLKEMVEILKTQNENIAVLQKSFNELAVGASRQDKSEETTKSTNPLEELSRKLGF